MESVQFARMSFQGCSDRVRANHSTGEPGKKDFPGSYFFRLAAYLTGHTYSHIYKKINKTSKRGV